MIYTTHPPTDIAGKPLAKCFLFVLAVLPFLSSCGQSTREEVIERYEGGEKRVVAVYKGAGVDEQLIERRTYDAKGDAILVENIADGTTVEWTEINAVATSKGLAEALQGEWTGTDLIGTPMELVFGRDEVSIAGELYSAENNSLYSLEYLPDYRAKGLEVDQTGNPVENKLNPDYVGPPHQLEAFEFVFRDHQSLEMKVITSIDARLEVTRPVGFFHRNPAYIELHRDDLKGQQMTAQAEAHRQNALVVLQDDRLRNTYPEWHADQVISSLTSKELDRIRKEDSRSYLKPYDELQAQAREAVMSSGMTSDEMLNAAIEHERNQGN